VKSREIDMLRLLLVILVIALGADALMFNGAYTQSAWRQLSDQAVKFDLVDRTPDTAPTAPVPQRTAP
jgi:hypothetical protein